MWAAVRTIVLRKRKNLLSVFVYANLEQRIARVAARNNLSSRDAETRIRNTDKHRAAYLPALP